MLPLSRRCQYAIRTMAFLFWEPARTVFHRREVSRPAKISHAFVSKILQRLTKSGLLRSLCGSQRGYSFRKRARSFASSIK